MKQKLTYISIFMLACFVTASLTIAAENSTETTTDAKTVTKEISKMVKTDEEWRKTLNEKEYQVMRKEATEPPFSSPLNDEKRSGRYVCAACEQPLFESAAKYDSGTGWPSFHEHIEGSINTKIDHKLGTPRVEYHCSRCGAHLGHIFDDGPGPEGKRHCNNGVALKFIPDEL